MIFTYNKEHVGDVLMVIVKDSKGAKLDYERKGNVSRVFLEKNGETVAWNIFEVSSLIAIDGVGQGIRRRARVGRPPRAAARGDGLRRERQEGRPRE